MVHDEKVTVPLSMYTPPPCKHKHKTYENPIGAMGTFELSGADGTYSILVLLDLEEAPIIKDENRNGHLNKAFSHRRWELFRYLWHVPPVVDRCVSHSCASESQGKLVSSFPIGAMGSFEQEHAPIQKLCCR